MSFSEADISFLKERFFLMTALERKARASGFSVVMGVDEAGRGPLAGPVVAASCILPQGKEFLGLDDSKKLSAKQRRLLRDSLMKDPDVAFGIGVVSVETIDEINILEATKLAMLTAIKEARLSPDYVLIDGLSLFVSEGVESEKVIKGDSRSVSIAAASILAKEHRDEIMRSLHQQYPEYGFDKHKGYGTASHLEMLRRYGPCPWHRKSFAPVKQAMLCKEGVK